MLKSRKSFTEAGVGIYEYILIPKDATEEEAKQLIKSALLQYGSSNKHLKIKPVVDIESVCKYGTVYVSESMDALKLVAEANMKNITIRIYKELSNDELEIWKQRFKK